MIMGAILGNSSNASVFPEDAYPVHADSSRSAEESDGSLLFRTKDRGTSRGDVSFPYKKVADTAFQPIISSSQSLASEFYSSLPSSQQLGLLQSHQRADRLSQAKLQ